MFKLWCEWGISFILNIHPIFVCLWFDYLWQRVQNKADFLTTNPGGLVGEMAAYHSLLLLLLSLLL